MLALASATALLVTGLQLPSSDNGVATRRAALKSVAGAALLPLLASPDLAFAVEGQNNDIGFTGALRNDIGPSILGSGVEVLISEQSYKELPACPSDFFVPAKGGPWSCLEITCVATNNVSHSEASFRIHN